MKNNRLKSNEKGFTLIALMRGIAIGIIGILAAITIPSFISYRDKAFCTAAETDCGHIMETLADYFAIPSNTTLSFPITLPTTSGTFAGFNLSEKNTATITYSVGCLLISVMDGSGRCPDVFGEVSPDWNKIDGKWYFRKCLK